MKLYKYVGSPDFIPKGEFPKRTHLESVDIVGSWMIDHRDELDIEECIAATYVIDSGGLFWIADRSSEHVACARVGEVLSAGEVFFSGINEVPYIDRITNQSTGYCPEPLSWHAVTESLSSVGIIFPSEFDPAFEFRHCEKCDTLNIVKDEYYTCMSCYEDLPEIYNVQ